MLGKFFLRLFGSGRLPPDSARFLDAEPQAWRCEALVGSITCVNFRAPRRYSAWRRQWFLGSLAITRERLLAYRYRSPLVNVSWDDPRLRQIRFSVPHAGCLLLVWDASLFQPTWTGTLEIRFATADAEGILNAIETRLRAGW